MSILSYLGQARKHAAARNLTANSAQVLDLVGQIADRDFYSGPAETKIELIAVMLERIEKAGNEIDLFKVTRAAISVGAWDDDLPVILSIIKRRQEVIASQRVAMLEIGQRIMISHECRPKMLAGQVVEVVGFEGGDKVKVKLLATYSSKWRSGNTITLPKSLVGQLV